MLKFLKFLIILAVLLLLTVAFAYTYTVNSLLSQTMENELFIIESGDTVAEISKNLEIAGLIKFPLVFQVYIRLNKLQTSLKAGSYTLNSGQSIKDISDRLVLGGQDYKETKITIIEGWTANDIAKYLDKETPISSSDFYIAIGRNENKPSDRKKPGISDDFSIANDIPAGMDLEGYLFPDTYRIFKDATADDIIAKMLANLDAKISPEMRAEIKRQGKSIFRIITMASIIEKEVRSVDDMKIVSGIFWDRIKNGQALESCASLAYILGVNKPQYTVKDTEIDSPYNTYQNRDLPPGPISNPGLNAITAAIYPTYSNYNFFLSRPDTGDTVFSTSYEEHLRNKNLYLK